MSLMGGSWRREWSKFIRILRLSSVEWIKFDGVSIVDGTTFMALSIHPSLELGSHQSTARSAALCSKV